MTSLFFTIRMPNLHSNIPSSAFCGTVMSETFRIVRLSSSSSSFYEKISALITHMEKQGENRGKLIKEIKRTNENHQLFSEV